MHTLFISKLNSLRVIKAKLAKTGQYTEDYTSIFCFLLAAAVEEYSIVGTIVISLLSRSDFNDNMFIIIITFYKQKLSSKTINCCFLLSINNIFITQVKTYRLLFIKHHFYLLKFSVKFAHLKYREM